MIYIFLGLWVLIFWAFSQSREKLKATFLTVQRGWAQGEGGSFLKKFLMCLGFSVLSLSPHQTRLTSLALAGRGRWNMRWSLVLICLSSLAVLFWAGLLSVAFQAPGAIFLVAGIGAVILPRKWPSLISFFWFIFFLGIFLHSVETTLRMSSFLNQVPYFQEFSLLAADNRLFSVLSWMFLSILITFFLPFEGWSWIFSVLGISMGVMGLNVAVGFVLGESLGATLVFLKVIRKDAPAFKKIALEYFLVTILSAAAFLFAFGLLKNELFELKSFGSGSLPEKVVLFLACVLAWSGFLTLIALVWGHFRATTRQKGSMSAESVSKWRENDGILPTFVQDLFSLSQKQKDQ